MRQASLKESPVNPGDDQLRELLAHVQTIAVVGIKTGDRDDAYRIPRYMQAHGYRIIPVNPKLERVLGQPALPSVAEIREPVDLVNLFRDSRHVPSHADEILTLSTRPRAVWMQLGIRHDAAARRLAEAGIAVVQDRCLMVEHERLLGDHRAGSRGA
jgi:predicted CoA-binding protein